MSNYYGTSGRDVLTGTSGNDVFWFNADDLGHTDKLLGAGGSNALALTNTDSEWQTMNSARLAGASHIGLISLRSASGAYGFELVFTDALYTTNQVKLLSIDASLMSDVAQGLHVLAGRVTKMDFLIAGSQHGWDHLVTGSGNDSFVYLANGLDVRDSIDAGAGYDTLVLVGAGETHTTKSAVGHDEKPAGTYVDKVGTTFLADVKHLEAVVVTQLDAGYTRQIQFGNTVGTDPYTGTGTISISTNKNWGTTAASAPIAGTLVVDGHALTARQALNATGGLAADQLSGGAAADRLDGGAGNDVLSGGKGNDLLTGGAGDDKMSGGAGGDKLSGGAGDDGFYVSDSVVGRSTGQFYRDTIDGGTGSDTLYFTAAAGIKLTAAAMAANTVSGIETISFAGASNTLVLSNAFVTANHDAAGALHIVDGSLVPSASTGNTLNIDASKVNSKGLHLDVDVYGTPEVTLRGTAGKDLFEFHGDSSGADSGLGFFDRIAAGQGSDTLLLHEGSVSSLGTGVSSLEHVKVLANGNGGSTTTQIDVASNAGMTIDGSALGAGDALMARGFAYDTSNPNAPKEIDSSGKLTLIGGAGADTLVGSLGANVIDGGAGNDTILGWTGADRITGGAGADLFVYRAVSDSTADAAGQDTITDFSHAQGDRIYFLHQNSAAFSFIGSAGFGHVAGQVRADFSGNDTRVQLDVNGDGQAEFQITLTGHITLGPADFVL